MAGENAAQFADVAWNEIAIFPGQYGLFFDDETSFNNVIALTNLVNGVPVYSPPMTSKCVLSKNRPAPARMTLLPPSRSQVTPR